MRESLLLARRWRARVDERLKPTGLTLARATVLYWLAEQPVPVTQRELADNIGIEGPTLVRQLHALEAQGLIERLPVAGDRRANGIRATPAAEPLLDVLREVTDRIIAESLSHLDKRRLASATQLLRDSWMGLS